jgi:hypothetical protein
VAVSDEHDDEHSRVRCDEHWYEVFEPPSELATLLDQGDDDWVELSELPDGRPIWLRASQVDYFEAARSYENLSDVGAWELCARLLIENSVLRRSFRSRWRDGVAPTCRWTPHRGCDPTRRRRGSGQVR